MNRTEAIARACHSAWYAYTVLGLGEEGEPWESAPEWQRASITDAVNFWDGFDESGSNDSLRRSLPEASHENWLKHKESDGWVYGPTKDPEAKTHPCMVPYPDLPPAQRKKDFVVVEAYLALRQLSQCR